ncbi:MAG TPA: HAD-IIIA family hydrolase [Actinomycetes bacterium]|nr:HAD-IIIA family hydrolase [Actinomycetes bacterium]
MSLDYAVVVPTIGRASLTRLLTSLAGQPFDHEHPAPVEAVVVDDRPLRAAAPPPLALPPLPCPTRVIRSGGRGPAAARNAGWRSVRTEWVVLLDDDVELPPQWVHELAADLDRAPSSVAGVQARLHVPVSADRPQSDWERNTAGLEQARWATADMAYRRRALAEVGGFDERFPRPYREDADLALRVRGQGWTLRRGHRITHHPVRPADFWVSVRTQVGGADDALMRTLHGPRWRTRAQTGVGRARWHAATVAAGALAAGAGAVRRHRLATAGGLLWLSLYADFLVRRLVDGPRPGQPGWVGEWARMTTTSAVIPPVALAHRVGGTLRHARAVPPWPPPVRAVLLDRDGTLVQDVPYNGDPDRVVVVADARAVLDRLRAAGLAVGVVTNQSGLALGWLTPTQVRAVNARIMAELGPFDVWEQCPHGPDAGCPCRKPGPALVLRAAARLGILPAECLVIGDTGADVGAGVAAGARAVLVPAPLTRPDEVSAAKATVGVAATLTDAVAGLVGVSR